MEEVKGSDAEAEKDGGASSGPPTSDDNNGSADGKPISLQGRMTGPTRRSSKGGWTEEEDKILAFAVQKFNKKNWKKIAECVPDRTDVQCLHRWQKVLNPDLVKGPWTKEEDERVIELVGKQGNKKWSEIAKYLPGRIGKQCRERWQNHLNPKINKTPWTKEEEFTLIRAHRIYGNKWAELTKFLNGRTENAIKNHWNCSIKKKLDLYSASGAVWSHPGFTARDSYNDKTEEGSKSLRMDSEKSMDTSLKLFLGNANERENHLQSFDQGNGRIPRDGSHGSIIPQFRACSRTGEKWQEGTKNVKASGDPHRPIANWPNASCKTSLSHHVNPLRSYKHTHKPGDLFNPSPPTLPPGYLPPSSNSPLDGTYGNVLSVKWLSSRDSSLSGRLNNSHSFRPACGSNKKTNDPETPSKLEEKNLGGLCYEPLQEEDLKIFVATGKFSSTDSYIRLPLTPGSFYTPKAHDRGKSIDDGSPESKLRRAAMSYKNMPSIMRKRGLRTSGQVSNTSCSDCTLEENSDTLNSPVLPNAIQLFLSPPKSQKLENSAAIQTVEKRLEFDFDNVWDSANCKLNISAEGDAAFGDTHDSDVSVTCSEA